MTNPATYKSGDTVVTASPADGGVRVIHLVTDDNGESWKVVHWKGSVKPVPRSGKVPEAAQVLLDPDYATALHAALGMALNSGNLSVTFTALSGQSVTVPATMTEPQEYLERLRATFGKAELAGMAAICHHMALVMDQAGAPPGYYPDAEDELTDAVNEAGAAADEDAARHAVALAAAQRFALDPGGNSPPPPAPYSP